MTYGYDTHIRHRFQGPISRNTIYDIAWNFLVALEGKRRGEPSRPLLFIVHSLGGIIVKEMLRRSSGCDKKVQAHFVRICDYTTGIIFFGTPHAGADYRGFLRSLAERTAKAVGLSWNEQIVDTLLPSSDRLKELRDTFGPMAVKREWVIYSFQEEYGMKILGGSKVCVRVQIPLHR
jgi:hypothetical protein